MTLHVFTEPPQPATFWITDNSPRRATYRWPGNRLLWCGCCNRRRPAKNCIVQSYYDCVRIWCAAGKGCKSTREIGAKHRRAFQNRSAGQKRRYAKEPHP